MSIYLNFTRGIINSSNTIFFGFWLFKNRKHGIVDVLTITHTDKDIFTIGSWQKSLRTRVNPALVRKIQLLQKFYQTTSDKVLQFAVNPFMEELSKWHQECYNKISISRKIQKQKSKDKSIRYYNLQELWEGPEIRFYCYN